VRQAHRLYQQANYDDAARLLQIVIQPIEASPAGATMPPRTKAAAYLATAKLATKVGDSSLAWVAADRCLRHVNETDQPALIGIANYQVACALLGGGHLADAEQTAALAVENIAGHAESARPDAISVRGALLLLLSVVSARRGAAQSAGQYLAGARFLADRLGQDGNRVWTAFGPTNVAIHELGVRVALDDSRTALELGQRLNTDTLPAVLRGRRSQVHLELGWAAAGQGDDSLAVLHVLEAERVAQQAVSRNATARTLLSTLLARERMGATPGLRALAARAGVLR
jgi:hypothetical protein